MRKADYIGLAQEIEIGERLASIDENSKIFHNVLLEVKGKTTQIDLLYLCERGLFVIESKNYRNTVITGELNHKMWKKWTSCGYKNFFSPVMQNKKHISVIGKLFGLANPYDLCSSVIVFPDSTNISDINDNSVIGLSNLQNHILATKTKKTLTSDIMQFIADTIKENNKSSVKSAQEKHDSSMKEMKSRFLSKAV